MRLIRKIQTKLKKNALEKALSVLRNQAEVIVISNTPGNLNQIRDLLYKSSCDFPSADKWFSKYNQDLLIKDFGGLFVFLKNGKDYSLLNINGLTDLDAETKKVNAIVGNVVGKTK